MKTRVSVREGNTGILYLTYEDGKQERFVPNYDLGEARRLLLTCQDLQDTTGSRLKDNYWREGINWLPTVESSSDGPASCDGDDRLRLPNC